MARRARFGPSVQLLILCHKRSRDQQRTRLNFLMKKKLSFQALHHYYVWHDLMIYEWSSSSLGLIGSSVGFSHGLLWLFWKFIDACITFYYVINVCNFISIFLNCWYIYRLGLAKQDLWGIGAETRFIVASCAFAHMILQSVNIIG